MPPQFKTAWWILELNEASIAQQEKKINHSAGKIIPCDTLDVANTFNNYLSEAAVNKTVDKVIDDFGDHSSIKLITERGN